MVPELELPVGAGDRLRLAYTNAAGLDRGIFADVLDARPDLDVDSVATSGDRVVAEVTVLRDRDRLGSILYPVTFSAPEVSHQLVQVTPTGTRGTFATAWRASLDNIQEGVQTARDRVAIPAAEVAEQTRKPLAISGTLLAFTGLLVIAVWAQVMASGSVR
jgi:hypothetical protein